ncbi:DUF5723 family protein [uncultured Polaribacter sp.]|uniref:DUF5723 family protein n=1 Tax=uncultured Polaribacter sp. TaxID=174711 RepID=UPI00262BC525|nr:DUF5723 family protein [uncultured Polaribacter sp.]
MKKIITLLFVFFGIISYSQNKQVLYDFAELPQTLLLNPGAETNYKFHVGVPMLSGLSLEIGSTGFTVSDIFTIDNIPVQDKVTRVLSGLTTKDHIKINTQIEVINAGFRVDKNYFSFGFYEEVDAFSYFPKDPVKLITDGNSAFLNRSFNFSQIVYKVDVLGVLHFGASREINEKLTIGGRFKIYSSAANLESSRNTGTFTTTEGTNNIYNHNLDNVDLNFRTSGIVGDDNEYIDTPETYLGNTFFGSNLGVGLDIGFTYHSSKQLEFTGSIVDFGFVNHKNNVKTATAKGSYVFEGVETTFDENDFTNYWDEFEENFKRQLPSGDNSDSYISWRPTKVNASLKYSYGERRSLECYRNTHKDFYANALGVQLFSVFRPLGPQLALTGFYERAFSKKFHAKFTYTLDEYSFYNIGAGLSAQLGAINLYGMVDNIAQFADIAASNNVSFQVGVNVIFN